MIFEKQNKNKMDEYQSIGYEGESTILRKETSLFSIESNDGPIDDIMFSDKGSILLKTI